MDRATTFGRQATAHRAGMNQTSVSSAISRASSTDAKRGHVASVRDVLNLQSHEIASSKLDEFSLVPWHSTANGDIRGFHDNRLWRKERFSVLLRRVAIRPIAVVRRTSVNACSAVGRQLRTMSRPPPWPTS